ncbi:50S ribosomal protein L23 [Candidatus Woesearchaeota archaeon CG08_land_8_20_14_0_20_47_9]|nr:MAG: 50S ribosomal protein L23 [Candidatus Woesearchaeota archaeon CG1_02_47_18]PIO04169.1 MAG: 50S ribosomal protein L23 [Candidatus Woesearchaeota archaeon CG08_land_8_20_14_0_20_47_9]HII29775.1 50S ribosomal protein L23 [Candidatus Woesearchaeota archaeon]
MDAYNIIKYPLQTEKAIRLMKAENKLVFVVDSKATKGSIRRALEELFKARIESVRVLNTRGEKRAYVRFGEGFNAIDITTQFS